jgi:hypothetical protein
MQLLAGQTSLEPRPHRESEAGRYPFVSQNTKGDGSRFASELAPHPRIPDPGLPETIKTSCRFGVFGSVSDLQSVPAPIVQFWASLGHP